MVVYRLSEIAEKNKQDECWLAIHNRVYDVTKFLNDHPGGEEVLLHAGGTDATEAFEDISHSLDAREMMKKYEVGELHPDDCRDYTTAANILSSPASSKVLMFTIPAFFAIVIGLLYKYYK